jgi:[ribosomal protein S5]-alanine N-acetyltransferase
MSAPAASGVALRPWLDVAVEDQVDFYVRNREAFAPWEPTPPPEFFEVRGQRLVREYTRSETESGRSRIHAVVAGGMRLAGRVSVTNIVRGAAQSAYLGYLVDASLWGQGIATQAVKLTLRDAFGSLALHRVEASIMPRNTRSLRVIEKCGFTRIGLSARHLRIAGVWEDHYIYSLTAEDWSAQQPA